MKKRISNYTTLVSGRSRGFTLVEILLVLLITSVLVLGVNAAFRQAHVLWSRIENQRPLYQKTRLFFDILRDELAGLYLPKPDEEDESAPFSLSSLPDGTIKLTFFTENPAWKNSVVSSYPAKISYEFSSTSEQKTLSRTEQLCSGEKTVSPERTEVIFTDLADVRIQAADPNGNAMSDSWKDNLDCRQSPPKAVRLSLGWPGEEEGQIVFETTITVVCQGQTATQ
jgi:prepilin-type N-terminal cleavage/methylation domain-containing protein